jgi:type IV pilus assembly protein PilX
MTAVHTRNQPLDQRGVALVSAMLLLIVMTILALYMFRSNGVQELIAGNIREKQRAIQTAEAAELYAEMWLTTSNNAMTNSVDCSALPLVSWPNTPVICSNSLATVLGGAANVTTLPWATAGIAEIGFAYFPGLTTGTGDLTVQATGGQDTYYQVPRFYIGLVPSSYNGHQALFRIDAWNYAGTQSTASVVESNYVVTCSLC